MNADRLAPATIRDRLLAFGTTPVMLCFEHADEIDAARLGAFGGGMLFVVPGPEWVIRVGPGVSATGPLYPQTPAAILRRNGRQVRASIGHRRPIGSPFAVPGSPAGSCTHPVP